MLVGVSVTVAVLVGVWVIVAVGVKVDVLLNVAVAVGVNVLVEVFVGVFVAGFPRSTLASLSAYTGLCLEIQVLKRKKQDKQTRNKIEKADRLNVFCIRLLPAYVYPKKAKINLPASVAEAPAANIVLISHIGI